MGPDAVAAISADPYPFLEDCVGSYFPEFHEMGLTMITAQGGIFGWGGRSGPLIAALGPT